MAKAENTRHKINCKIIHPTEAVGVAFNTAVEEAK